MNDNSSIGLDANAALRKIFKDPAWKLQAGIGSTINALALVLIGSGEFALPLVPVAFLVAAAAQGYILKVLRTAIQEPEGCLPQWSGWADLLISGLTWIALLCGQIVALFSVLYFSLLFGAERGLLNAQKPEFAIWTYSTIGAMALVLFTATFFLPLLMANFAENERVTAALNIPAALKRLYRNPEQFVLVWLLSLGTSTIAIVIPALTVFGLFLIPLTTFLANLFNAVILAQVWRDSNE
jgi:hypothetical protein